MKINFVELLNLFEITIVIWEKPKTTGKTESVNNEERARKFLQILTVIGKAVIIIISNDLKAQVELWAALLLLEMFFGQNWNTKLWNCLKPFKLNLCWGDGHE